MRWKTIKRLGILIVVLGLIDGGGYLLWLFQVGKMARGVIARAAEAEKSNDLATAEQLYREHLAVVRDDPDVMVKLADVLARAEKTPKRQSEAMGLYDEILRRTPANVDVRLKVAKLAVEMGGAYYPIARRHLSNLQRSQPDDGELEFLLGRCYEQEKDAAKAADSYKAAIEHGAREHQLEASRRRAALLRDPLDKAEAADQVIEQMVQSDPNNYRVYLERGRYRSRFGLPGANDDFQKARQQAGNEPEIYLEMAKSAESESRFEAARAILDDGLKVAPKSVALYLALTDIEIRAGRAERAVEVLESGLQVMPNAVELRFRLAMLLAGRGETGKLRVQIEALKQIGFNEMFMLYLASYYYVNNQEFSRAREILVPLQVTVAGSPDLKARVNVLLAECYGQLNEFELQQDAYQRAVSANPQDLLAQLGLISGMIKRGETDRAIEAYRQLMNQAPAYVRFPLAQLLIERNRQRPESQRDWSEAERLIADAAKAAPGSVEPVILQARLLLERGQNQNALDLLAKSRLRFSKNPELWKIWAVEAAELGQQRKFDEALGLLDQAQQQLGDRVELRLARARLWVTKGGPQVVTVLNDLAKNLQPFSRKSRRELLTALANELNRQQDLPGATRLWSQLAEQEPDELEPQLQLLELAFQSGDKAAIEKIIKAIERIDGLHGRYYQARYLIWQAQHTGDAGAQQILRTDARALLNELKSRRQDWSLIPLAQAQLEEQELTQDGLTEDQKRTKLEALINNYLRAIDLGYRNLAVIRRTVQLLVAAGRSNEVLQLYNRSPVANQLAASDLGRWAAQIAVANRDYQQAEEISRAAVAARPNDFQERMWLIRILLDSGRHAEAEAELQRAISGSPSDPNPRLALIQVLILTKQTAKAEQAVRDAEEKLTHAPLELARCCELMGRAYEGENADEQEKEKVRQWYREAQQWYAKAQDAQPKGSDDFSIARRLTEFFLRTNQIAEAEKQLRQLSAIPRPAASTTAAGTVAWARRSLALTYISGSDYEKIRQALALFELENRQGGTAGDPDDLRVLARVLDAQRTPEHRTRALEILRSLVNRNLATADDRLVLARLEEVVGDWHKAREQFRELIQQAESARDLETLNRRPIYLIQFAEAILRNHRPGEDQDLAEIQELITKLKQIQPDMLGTFVLEVELDRARNRLDDAKALIQSYADRFDRLPRVFQTTLPRLAEGIKQFDLAENLYRRLASAPANGQSQSPQNQSPLPLAQFLGRRDRVKEALDICESLWRNPRNLDPAAVAAIQILFPANGAAPDPVQLGRVVGWLEDGLVKNPQSTTLLIGLANLKERQGNYQKAQELYRSAIGQNDRDGVASNNLAWLMAFNNEGQSSDALKLVNDAIRIKGPIPDYLDTRGVVYLTAGDGQHAIADLKAAVAIDPSAAKLFHLAQAYLKVNDRDKAKQSLAAAKTKGLPIGLHPLEQTAYDRVIHQIEAP
jgi:tetratricopeptide (TPR) repeat protein